MAWNNFRIIKRGNIYVLQKEQFNGYANQIAPAGIYPKNAIWMDMFAHADLERVRARRRFEELGLREDEEIIDK